MSDVLCALQAALEDRRNADPADSYVASLYSAGLNKILEKVGEEATVVIVAAKDYDSTDEARAALLGEVADLWFHSMVLLTHLGLSQEEVLDALGARLGISGHTEKQSRSKA